MRLLDVDNDGRPEAVVSFSSARGGVADWVLKWNGATLDSIGPMSVDPNGNTATLLCGAEFADINGDGLLEIVSAPQAGPVEGGQPVSADLSVFGLSNGRYVRLGSTLAMFATFARSTAAPFTATRHFTVAVPSSHYVMIIVNGDGAGLNTVSSAEVTLNGTVVAGPQMFNQQSKVLRIPVQVGQTNTLTVRLASAPLSQLKIGIGPE